MSQSVSTCPWAAHPFVLISSSTPGKQAERAAEQRRAGREKHTGRPLRGQGPAENAARRACTRQSRYHPASASARR